VNSHAENFYAGWRSQCRAADVLRDKDGFPAERLLQAVWRHQRLRRDQLKTSDGKTVRVLHPGFASVEGGPDFRGAVIQIGDEPPRSGDVEIDLRSHGWHAHGHDRNPNFQNVILHVVWDPVGVHASACLNLKAPDKLKLELQPLPPTLFIMDKLDAPLGELSLWLESESTFGFPENLRGQCSAPLRELDEPQLAVLLHQATRVRLEAKAAQFSARARHAGWEQALWEGLFRALGYKHNAWPMQNLAESRPLWSRGAKSPLAFQARLLGIGGLLPGELTRSQKSSDTYLRRVWDCWWRERDEFADITLPRAVWKFHGLRPANHPQRRLALAAYWLADKKMISKIENWCVAGTAWERRRPAGGSSLVEAASPPAGRQRSRETSGCVEAGRLSGSLHEILQVERDEFWSWHWTFKSARLAKPQPLLGGTRATDLAVNVILPWLWARAAEGKNAALQREIERRYFDWPAAEDNAVLKLARQRLLGTSSRRALRSAAEQQGLMQIVRDFCEHSNAVCDHCRLPECVRGWNRGTGVQPV
jgi:hypothetical protein